MPNENSVEWCVSVSECVLVAICHCVRVDNVHQLSYRSVALSHHRSHFVVNINLYPVTSE